MTYQQALAVQGPHSFQLRQVDQRVQGILVVPEVRVVQAHQALQVDLICRDIIHCNITSTFNRLD